jgi:peptidoglycan L-alanyl-D-glutamate endopeptidase CwlK
MLVGVILYFLLAISLLALALFPPARERAWGAARQCWRRGRAAGASVAGAGRLHTARAGAAAGSRAGRLWAWVAQHAAMCGLAAAMLAGLPLAAVLLRAAFPLSSYDHTLSRPADERVAELLRGEQLVAPPALPPEWFTTREVEQARPMTATASRQWELLDESFRQRLLMVFKLLREQHGYELVLLEGYRSPERQAALMAMGPSVTQAGPFESYHQQGLAADCAFIKDGRIVISERDPWAMRGYELYGEVARSLGLTWGGDWRSLKDFGHLEWHRAAAPAQTNTSRRNDG